jgi:2-haloacid dehalogenase
LNDSIDPRRPALLVFDVNETLSDMAPIAGRFDEVGAPAHLARTWFAGLLRDGFALTVAHENPSFARLGAEGSRRCLRASH